MKVMKAIPILEQLTRYFTDMVSYIDINDREKLQEKMVSFFIQIKKNKQKNLPLCKIKKKSILESSR